MRILITGGAGFIGSNAAAHYARQGHEVLVVDNFCRPGSRDNWAWLSEIRWPHYIRLREQDIRHGLGAAVQAFRPDVVLHLAAQVAVTTSVEQPAIDFQVNAWGTMQVLEAVRKHAPEALVIYASTNKVYGDLAWAEVQETPTRYVQPWLPEGLPSTTALRPETPYGVSKAAGDMYMRDYARIYGLRTVVARQSCIYGPHQYGVEDQGWAAYFLLRWLSNLPLTIYGNGKQVRDLLHVEDLLAFYDACIEQPDVAVGQAYNVGGGPAQSLSIWREFRHVAGKALGKRPPDVAYGAWRPHDQKVYVSGKNEGHALGWSPKIAVADGLADLARWCRKVKESE